MIAEAQAAREESRKLRRYIVTAGLAVLLPVVALLATVIIGAVMLVRLQDVAEINRATGAAVVECTTPENEAPEGFKHPDGTSKHECLERSQENLAKAIHALTVANECVADGLRGTDVDRCVAERLGPQENP